MKFKELLAVLPNQKIKVNYSKINETVKIEKTIFELITHGDNLLNGKVISIHYNNGFIVEVFE